MSSKMKPSNRSTRSKPQAGQTATKRSNQGMFRNSIWYCNCEPKLPAEHFQVKKQSKNKGRWFYTCQKDPEERCKFFLWGDEAAKREKETVLNNSRSEAPPETRKMRGIFDGISLSDELALAQALPDFDNDETESEAEQVDTPSRIRGLPFTSEQGRSSASDGLRKKLFQGNAIADAPSTTTVDTQAQAVETPKLDRAATAYATPAKTTDRKRVLPWEVSKMDTNNKRDHEDEIETPSKKAKLDPSMTLDTDDIAMPNIHRGVPIATTDDGPVATNTKPVSNHVVAATTIQQVRPLTPAQKESVVIPETPAPIRFKDALPPAATTNFNLLAAIEKELAACNVPPAVMSKIRQHVKKQEMIGTGYLKARDGLRKQLAALKPKPETNKLFKGD